MKRFLILAVLPMVLCAIAVSPSEASVIKKDVNVHETILTAHNDIYAPAKAAFIHDALVPAGIALPDVKINYLEFKPVMLSKGVFKRQRLRCRSPS